MLVNVNGIYYVHVCDMLVTVNVIYYAHVCEQARWVRSAGSSAIENVCIIYLLWSWRVASAQHDTKNWEIHWYPEPSANKAKTKSLIRKRLYTNAYGKDRKNRP